MSKGLSSILKDYHLPFAEAREDIRGLRSQVYPTLLSQLHYFQFTPKRRKVIKYDVHISSIFLLFVLEGAVEIQQDDQKRHQIDAGNYYITEHQVGRYEAKVKEGPARLLTISFEPRWLLPPKNSGEENKYANLEPLMLSLIKGTQKVDSLRAISIDQKIVNYLRQLQELDPTDQQLMDLAYYHIALRILRHYHGQLSTELDDVPLGLAQQARLVIESNLFLHDLGITRLTELLNCTSKTLQRHFKAGFHTSVYAYILQKKMEKARTLLASGASISETLLLIGYTDKHSFRVQYKLRIGENPSDTQKRGV